VSLVALFQGCFLTETTYAHLGASPDGLISCKCSRAWRASWNKVPIIIQASPSWWDVTREVNIFIRLNGHKYYTQIQGQLSVISKHQFACIVHYTNLSTVDIYTGIVSLLDVCLYPSNFYWLKLCTLKAFKYT